MSGELKRLLFAAVVANIVSGSNAGFAIASESHASADFGMSVDPLLSAI